MDNKCAPFFSCGGRGLKNRQKPLRVIFLPSLACRDQSQIIDLDRGSGHRSCTCTMNPKNSFFLLLLLCQPFYISQVSLFLFFSPHSSVAQTLKNVGPLDSKLRLLRRRSQLSLGGKPRGGHALVDFERSLSELSCGFSCCCFSFFFFFSFTFSLPFFFSVVTLNFSFFEKK